MINKLVMNSTVKLLKACRNISQKWRERGVEN